MIAKSACTECAKLSSLIVVLLRCLIFLGICCLPLCGAEQALLKNGFRIRCLGHQLEGDVVQLETATGRMTLPASEIVGFEVEEAAPALPAPVAVVAEAAPKPKATARELIDQAADRYGIPAAFLHSVVQAESAYQEDALSPKGAIGLMQLMPATAKGLGANPHDPSQNVDAGTRMLTELLVRFKDDPDQVRKALAAYNAGLGAVQRYNGVPPYLETQLYVEKILAKYQKLSK